MFGINDEKCITFNLGSVNSSMIGQSSIQQNIAPRMVNENENENVTFFI